MCSLSKFQNENATHWVSKLGNLFPIDKYTNHGGGVEKFGFKDLPNEYPYTIKYEKYYKFRCCKECKCTTKYPLEGDNNS